MSKKSPVFALIDCNNFFVSCERVFRPDLWHKPVAVMSNNDGCIVARSNEVKALGVPMGVPVFKVRDTLANNKVTLFSGNFPLYGDFSQRVVQILEQQCPDIEVYSVDESFLEISSLPIADYTEWAANLRAQILQWIGIPVSIGVAQTKTLAKAASEYAKQNPSSHGVHSIVADRSVTAIAVKDHLQALLRWLPVQDIWGVGWRSAPKLLQRGIATAADLVATPDDWAREQLSIRGLKTVKELRGESCIPLESNGEPQKTIARTRSFSHNVRDYHQLESAIASFAAQTAMKLRQQDSITTAVLTYLRTPMKFEGSRGGSAVVRLIQPSADTGSIIAAALEGLQRIYDPDFAYKKGGVVLVDILPKEAWQLSLLENNPESLDKQVQLMQSVDAINTKYGTRLVRHAVESPLNQQWLSKREQRSPAYTTQWHQLPVIKS